MDVAAATAICSLPVWGYVAVSDLRTRRAPNAAWVVLAALGVASFLAHPSLGRAAAVAYGLALLVPASVYLNRSGRMGGADAKALSVLPLLYPYAVLPIVLGTAILSMPWVVSDEHRVIPLLAPLTGAVFLAVLTGTTILFV